jgi:pyruvate dehydrogenase E1 component beta subunit
MHMDFTAMAMDALVNQVPKARYMTGGQVTVPMVIRTPAGGYRSSAAQHGQSLESLYTHIPGMLVVAPSTPADAKGLLKTAIRLDDPVFFVEHKSLYMLKGEVPDGEHLVPIGIADVKRIGKDVTIICHSKTVAPALNAAKTLEGEGIEVEVVDLRTIAPLDEAMILASVRKTNRVVVAEEGWSFAGVGAQVVDLIQREGFDALDAPIVRVHQADVPMPYNKHLEKAAKADAGKIVAAVHKVCYRN